jgi:hypothetical protein
MMFQRTKSLKIRLQKAIEHEDGAISWSMKASEVDLAFVLLRRHRHSRLQTTRDRSIHPNLYSRRSANAALLRRGVVDDTRIDLMTTRAELLPSGIMNHDAMMIATARARAVTGIATQGIVLTRTGIALNVTVDAKRDD